MLTDQERRQLLDAYVEMGVASGYEHKATIEDGFGAFMLKRGGPSFSKVVHVVLTLVSTGLWIPVYLYLKWRGTERVRLHVWPDGRVTHLDSDSAARAGLYGEDAFVDLRPPGPIRPGEL